MTGTLERLRSLSQAQRELEKNLEAKLLRAERKAAMLSAKRAELDAVAAGEGGLHMAFLPAALRGLADTESELKDAVKAVSRIQQDLLSAKGRQKNIAERAQVLRAAEERKREEEDALETALVMGSKACRKPHVLG